ncbi:LemA family protein [Tessaracoccus sp. MC1865]|uniref:LemA family protein n=1 Tax=Tessaracoccus sp. MC1865 TaxID=2760310 RepID=UPI0016047426|nr:LemA family protein [Tessaracoccus sp. MC1865]MBB1482674.1 LemA family protein [Tessaracoccus sp. MC1865]QTO37877.1 LemA family protein [Tessaracoccus sp. MC1865]
MDTLLIILAVLVVLALGVVLWGVAAYNGFVKSRNLIQESWRQIDVELNRRYELIPNLVETVRGYAAHERNTLEQITALRNQARALAGQSGGQPSQERAAVESELTQAVHNLLVSVEAYPDLKSNQNFMQLQRELTDTEDRIAASRRFYNANVRDYNTRIESVPSNIIAGFAKFEKATYFEVNDPMVRQAPDVNFGEISQRPPAAPEQQQQIAPQQQYQQPVQPPQQQIQQPQQQPAERPPFEN